MKDPLVTDETRSKGELIDDVLKKLGAEKGITIWVAKNDKGQAILYSNMFNCYGWHDSFGLVEAWKDDAHAHRVAQNNNFHSQKLIDYIIKNEYSRKD